jgi:predicted DNA-binding protein
METKGITCKIPLDLHERISEEMRESGRTVSQYMEMIIREHLEGGSSMSKTRIMAFQVSEELFQKIKEYLARYEEIYHRKLTQRDFVLGLIESALEEAEDDFAAYQTAQQEEQNESWGGCDSEESLNSL